MQTKRLLKALTVIGGITFMLGGTKEANSISHHIGCPVGYFLQLETKACINEEGAISNRCGEAAYEYRDDKGPDLIELPVCGGCKLVWGHSPQYVKC